jgi:hypothetical protein
MEPDTRHIRWHDEPELTNPVMVVAFTGWNDAGDAASTALTTLIETSGARPLAEIDPEVFTDFATVRPHVRLDDEQRRSIVWPTVGAWSASLPGGDVIFVLGPEPALRWKLFSAEITAIALRFGCRMVISLGALLAVMKVQRASLGCFKMPSPLLGCPAHRSGQPYLATPLRCRHPRPPSPSSSVPAR